MKRVTLSLLALLAVTPAMAGVKVICSAEDMADFTRQIGGDLVEVSSLTQGQIDLHTFIPRPSLVARMRRADMVVAAGMELDAFLAGMLRASRNTKIQFGKPGFVDPAKGVHAKGVPTGKISGKLGDVHPHGNPHFWYTNENVRLACRNIADGLIRVDPENKDTYEKNLADYLTKVDEVFARCAKKMEPFAGTKILQYHESWDYFAEAFGLKIVGSLEPKPGLPPSASHLRKMVDTVKKNDVKLVLVEVYYPTKPSDFMEKHTDIQALRLPLFLGGVPEKKTYLDNLEYMVDEIVKALKK